MPSETDENAVSWFEELNADDVSRVGGKNASLGEMMRMLKHEGIRVPGHQRRKGSGGNRSNDLTQMILGVDRDTTNIAHLYPYGRRE